MSPTDDSKTARRRWALASLACVVAFAALMHWPVFVQGKTVSSFDLSYFRFNAYRDQRPPELKRASNNLLSDPVQLFNVWDPAMYEGPLEPPWLWNPYAACGSPLLANAQSAPFSPLKALAYAPAGVRWGFGLHCFLKMMLAGLFMWAYMRALGAGVLGRTLGALAFMTCGFMVVWLQWIHTNVGMLLPLVLLGCEHLARGKLRAGFLYIAAATGLGLLGGHPETSFHIALAAGVYLVLRLMLWPSRPRRARLRLTGAGVGVLVVATAVGAMVSGIQLVPTVDATRFSVVAKQRAVSGERARARAAERGGIRRFLGDPEYIHNEVLVYLVPYTWGKPQQGLAWLPSSNYNERAAYAGIGVMLLAALGWRYVARDRRLVALGVLQLLSLGFILKVPLVEATLGRLPLLDIAANKRLLLVFSFANAAMAGLVFEHLWKAKKFSRATLVWMALILAAFLWLVLRDYAARFASSSQAWMRAYGLRQLLHFVVFLAPWAVVLFLWRMRAALRTAVAAGLIGLVAVDVYLTYFGYNPFIRPEQIYPSTPAIEFLQAQEAPVRVLPLDKQLGPNSATIYGLGDPRIFDALRSISCEEFLTRLGAEGTWHIIDEPNMRLCAVAGVRYVYAPVEWSPPSTANLELVYEDELSRIYENHDALPPAYVSHAWRQVASPDEAYDALAADEFPWQSCVTVEGQGDSKTEPGSGGEPRPHVGAQIVERRPQRVTIEIPQDGGGLLVLSDTFYPGWKAFVDGERRPIHRANGTFRGVFIDPGDRQVIFTYEPASFRYGLMLTVAGLVALVGVAVAPRLWALRRRAGSSSQP